jgi:hypothetical protein
VSIFAGWTIGFGRMRHTIIVIIDSYRSGRTFTYTIVVIPTEWRGKFNFPKLGVTFLKI